MSSSWTVSIQSSLDPAKRNRLWNRTAREAHPSCIAPASRRASSSSLRPLPSRPHNCHRHLEPGADARSPSASRHESRNGATCSAYTAPRLARNKEPTARHRRSSRLELGSPGVSQSRSSPTIKVNVHSLVNRNQGGKYGDRSVRRQELVEILETSVDHQHQRVTLAPQSDVSPLQHHHPAYASRCAAEQACLLENFDRLCSEGSRIQRDPIVAAGLPRHHQHKRNGGSSAPGKQSN